MHPDKNSKKIYLNIYYKEAKPDDVLNISIDDILFIMLERSDNEINTTMNDKGYFRFEIPVTTSTGSFNLTKKRTVKGWESNRDNVKMLLSQFWEIGDSIDIHISFTETFLGLGAKYNFFGKGSEKYNLINELTHSKVNSKMQMKAPSNWNGNILAYDEFDSINSTEEKLSLLDSYKNRLSKLTFDVIKSDIIFADRNGIFSQIRTFVRSGRMKDLDQKTKDSIIRRFNNSFDYPNNYSINQEALAKSPNFIKFLFSKLKAACYLNTGELSMDWIYNTIKEDHNISHEIRETIITLCLWSKIHNSRNQEALYRDAANFIKNPKYLKVLNELNSRLPGKEFIEFALKDVKGNIRSLSEFKNKVILIDFWFTGCSTCAYFYQTTLSKVENHFKSNANVVFLSISMDKDKFKWIKSVNEKRYTSDEAINLYTNGLGFKHPIMLKNNIITAPYVVLLDKEANIKWSNSADLYNEESLIKEIINML